MRHSKIGPSESDFVKDKRNTHCAGCMNENGEEIKGMNPVDDMLRYLQYVEDRKLN